MKKKKNRPKYVVAALTHGQGSLPIADSYCLPNVWIVCEDPHDGARILRARGYTSGLYVVMTPVCVLTTHKVEETWPVDYIELQPRKRPRQTRVKDADDFTKYVTKVRDDAYNKKLRARNLKAAFGE